MSENFKKFLNPFEFECDLPGSGERIKYKPVTVGQIKRMMLYENTEDPFVIENALDSLISECVITEGFDIKKLFIPDRFYLLVEIRNATKGSNYKFGTRCFSCNSQVMVTVDLHKLPVKKLDKKIPEIKNEDKEIVKKGILELVENEKKQENLFDIEEIKKQWNYVQLNENIGIVLDLMTRGKQLEVMNLVKQYKNKLTDEQINVEYNIMGVAILIKNVITSEGIEKNVSFEDKIFLIEHLLPDEEEKIIKWLDENNFGLDFTFKAKCIHCGNEVEREIPLENFFY